MLMCTVLLPPGVNPIAVKYISYHIHIGFGGIEVACWPLITKFAGSNAKPWDF